MGSGNKLGGRGVATQKLGNIRIVIKTHSWPLTSTPHTRVKGERHNRHLAHYTTQHSIRTGGRCMTPHDRPARSSICLVRQVWHVRTAGVSGRFADLAEY